MFINSQRLSKMKLPKYLLAVLAQSLEWLPCLPLRWKKYCVDLLMRGRRFLIDRFAKAPCRVNLSPQIDFDPEAARQSLTLEDQFI